MLRNTRTLRRAFATAVTAGALLALPGSALAAADISFTVTKDAVVESGAVKTYTVVISNNTGDATTGNADISLTAEGTFGLPSTTQYGSAVFGATTIDQANSDDVSEAFVTNLGNGSFRVATGFAGNEDVTIKVPVTLPIRAKNFKLSGVRSGNAGEVDAFPTSAADEITKGGPTTFVAKLDKVVPAAGSVGAVDEWIQAGTTTVTSNVFLTNYGPGVAHNVKVRTTADANASILSPTFAPNQPFVVTVAVPANAVCTPIAAAGECTIPTLAAGQSVAIPVTATGFTHFGDFSLSSRVIEKSDFGSDGNFDDGTTGQSNESSKTIYVTDGTVTGPQNALEGPGEAANGNTELSFKGELTNNGPSPLKNGLLEVYMTTFNATGDSTGGTVYTDTPGAVPSTVSIAIVGGAPCSPQLDNTVNPAKTYVDRYVCPVPEVAAGTRTSYEIKARFATAKLNRYGYVSTDLTVPSYASKGSETEASDGLYLNVDKTHDLAPSVASQALIGADRVAPQTVTITNSGNTKAEGVRITGTIDPAYGQFDGASLPGNCTSINKPQYASCGIGDIEPGASKVVTTWVKAGTKLGTLPTTYEVYGGGMGLEINRDNDKVTQVMTIVKANAVPLLGVKVGKATAQPLAKVGKVGVKTDVTVPGAATIKVQLTVTPAVAQKLGLIKAPKKKAGKAKLAPKFYVIGTSTTKATKAGKVTTTTKLSLKFKAKVMKAKAKFAVKRVITVTSNEVRTAGATSLTTQTLTFTPAKKAKKPKK